MFSCEIAKTFKEHQVDQSWQSLLQGQDFDVFSLPFSEQSDMSPLGLDMGPLMAGVDLENFL